MAHTAHRGSCHCGKVTFTAEADLSQPVLECNCSHCSRKGFLLAFIPPADLTVETGEDALVEYRFYKHTIAHQFSPTCGVEPFAWGDGPDGTMAAINVRCIEGVDLAALTRQLINGAEF